MQIYINLLPIHSGGGLQNACSFVSSGFLNKSFVIYANDIYSIREAAIKGGGLPLHSQKGNFLSRLLTEFRLVKNTEKKVTCFTFFGPPPMLSKGRLINVVGCAYSNLFYPEIDFWQDYRGLSRIKKFLIDHYRRWGTARADYWIFETEAIARRAIERFSFPADRVFVVRMAPSRLVLTSGAARQFPELPPDRFLTLYLASPSPNKRIDALIDVAQLLRDKGETRFGFVLTLSPDSGKAMALLHRIERLGLGSYFFNVGTIRPEHVGALINHCHAMCNLARLESFSNNFVEAWAIRKPLVVTDADWSRASCGDGAVYVDPSNPATIIEALLKLREDPIFRSSVVERGSEMLDTYPSTEQKAKQYLEIINRDDLSTYSGASVWRART